VLNQVWNTEFSKWSDGDILPIPSLPTVYKWSIIDHSARTDPDPASKLPGDTECGVARFESHEQISDADAGVGNDAGGESDSEFSGSCMPEEFEAGAAAAETGCSNEAGDIHLEKARRRRSPVEFEVGPGRAANAAESDAASAATAAAAAAAAAAESAAGPATAAAAVNAADAAAAAAADSTATADGALSSLHFFCR